MARKPLLKLLVVMLTLSLLAACGSKPAPAPAPAAPAPAQQPAAKPAAPAPAPAAKPAAADPELDKAFEAAVKEIPGLKKELVAAAKAEGKLVVYHLAIPFPPLLDEFKKRFPFIKIETFMGSGPPVYQKFTTEQRAGNFLVDIWQHTEPGQTNEIVPEGLLAEYKVLTADKYPAGMKNEGYWYPLGLARITIAYNPNVLSKEDITVLQTATWDTVADPRWKGKAGMTMLVGGAGTLPIYYWWKDKGVDFMKKMYANQPLLFSGNNPAAERLAAGEYGIMFSALEGSFYTKYKDGAPIQYVVPEPVLALPFTQAVVKKAPNPNAARLFQEWFFSDAGQKIWQKISGYPSGNKDVPDERDVAKEPWYRSGKKFYDWKFDEMTKASAELRTVYNQLTANLKQIK